MSASTPLVSSPPALELGRRRPEDRAALVEMYREVFGAGEAEANLERWRWQYEENPFCTAEGPEIWIAREGGTILGQYATMPVRLKVRDSVLRASWGMDVMVRRNLQRRGVGTQLFLYWDQHVEASLGLGLSAGSYNLFKKLKWQDVGPVPCYTKPIDLRVLASRHVGKTVAAVVAPALKALVTVLFPARKVAPGAHRVQVTRLEGAFDSAFDALWDNASRGYDFIAERTSAYLDWKFKRAPHVSYEVFQATREGALSGYMVLRVQERPAVRLGLIVDLFAHPEDHATLDALLAHAILWGNENRVGRLQTFTLDRRIGARLRRLGFFETYSPMQFCLKIHGGVDETFFSDTSRWHVTFGDSDQDRRP